MTEPWTKLLSCGRLVVQLGWSADGCWDITSSGGRRHAFLLALCTVTAPTGDRLRCLLLGPIQLSLGWVTA